MPEHRRRPPHTVMRHLPCFRLLAEGSPTLNRTEAAPAYSVPEQEAGRARSGAASRRSRTSKCSSALRCAALPRSFLSRRWFVATKLIFPTGAPRSLLSCRTSPTGGPIRSSRIRPKIRPRGDAQVQSKVAVLDLMPPFIKSPGVCTWLSNHRLWRNHSVSTRCA